MSISAKGLCPSCGRQMPTDSPGGLCPECWMKAGFETGAAPQPGEPTQSSIFAPPSIPELGRLFPQLEIVELLGHGGMGAVYKARQPALDRWMALKVLPPQSVAKPGFAERFNREARALARLNHPGIVAVHEFGQVDGLPFLILEYVDGVTLRRLVQERRLAPNEALQVVPQICEALQFAHDAGIVHRDIKPENILLDKKGRVKIADFGIAKILDQPAPAGHLTGNQPVIGTPHYMAPEQVEKPQSVDHRADIYSLGVVFYEMLTGELPLGRFAPPSHKVEVDVRLDEVVLRALEKEPERRYQQASQMRTDVQTITRSQEPPLAPERPPERQTVAAARNYVQMPALGLLVTGLCNPARRWWLAGITAATLLAAIIFWFARPNTSQAPGVAGGVVQASNPVSAKDAISQPGAPPMLKGPFSLQVDRETMQNIVSALRQQRPIRLCLENLDFDPEKDGVTLGRELRELEQAARTRPLWPAETNRLALARKLLAEGKPESMIFDIGERYQVRIIADSMEALLARLTPGTAYTWGKVENTFVLRPRNGSKLAYAVTLNTEGMTVEQAVQAILQQQPDGSHIGLAMTVGMPVRDGADPMPWLRAKAPPLTLSAVTALEALCRVTAGANPDSVWELAGMSGARSLGLLRGPSRPDPDPQTTVAAYSAGVPPMFRSVLDGKQALDLDTGRRVAWIVKAPPGNELILDPNLGPQIRCLASERVPPILNVNVFEEAIAAAGERLPELHDTIQPQFGTFDLSRYLLVPTDRGRWAILELTGFDEQPPKLQVAWSLFEIETRADGVLQLAPVSRLGAATGDFPGAGRLLLGDTLAITNESPAELSPAIERAIRLRTERDSGSALDLDSGRMLDLPVGSRNWSAQQRRSWLYEQHLELAAAWEVDRWYLQAADVMLKVLPADRHASPSLAQLRYALASGKDSDGSPVEVVIVPEAFVRLQLRQGMELPCAFAFQTAAGQIGFLELVSAAKDPHTLYVRYRLVQDSVQQK